MSHLSCCMWSEMQKFFGSEFLKETSRRVTKNCHPASSFYTDVTDEVVNWCISSFTLNTIFPHFIVSNFLVVQNFSLFLSSFPKKWSSCICTSSSTYLLPLIILESIIQFVLNVTEKSQRYSDFTFHVNKQLHGGQPVGQKVQRTLHSVWRHPTVLSTYMWFWISDSSCCVSWRMWMYIRSGKEMGWLWYDSAVCRTLCSLISSR